MKLAWGRQEITFRRSSKTGPFPLTRPGTPGHLKLESTPESHALPVRPGPAQPMRLFNARCRDGL